MTDGNLHRTVVFGAAGRDACQEARLILEAAGIAAAMVPRGGDWLLVVDSRDGLRAARELEAYRVENPREVETGTVPLVSGGRRSLVGYAGLLVGFAALSQGELYGIDWLDAGSMQAGKVVAGEWWRVVTALTLHLDTAHLLANLVFGAVFGLFAAQALGGGVGWLGILLGGGLGNAANAIVQPAQHAAVGASTAVFSALGILVSHALRHRRRAPGGAVRRWSPLVGGVLLFVYTGIGGPRTDVVAHATGLLAGLLVGALGSLIPLGLLRRRPLQIGTGAAVIGLITTAWVLALAAAHPTNPSDKIAAGREDPSARFSVSSTSTMTRARCGRWR